MKRGACLALLAPLALLALAACGGSGHDRLSKAAYEAKLRTAFAAANAGKVDAHRPVRDETEVIKGVAAMYERLASSLEDIRPPANVQALHDRLVEGASVEAAALGSLVAKLDAAAPARRARLLAEFDASRIAGRQELDAAVAGLEARGYRFRPNAGT